MLQKQAAELKDLKQQTENSVSCLKEELRKLYATKTSPNDETSVFLHNMTHT
jgi:hypothetical protein